MRDTKIVSFRPFKIPPRSSFNQAKTDLCEAFMIEDLAKSGLVPEDLYAYAHGQIWMPKEAESGYVIPYFYPNGDPITGSDLYMAMWRARLKAKQNLECQRYTQPSKEQLEKYGLPASLPYFPPYERNQDILIICEGEKKAVAVIVHLGLDAIGIGGCNNWMDENGTTHSWILEAARGKKVFITPDADIMRYDISRSYGTFIHDLIDHGITAKIVKMPDKVDDWIMSGGTADQFWQLPLLEPNDLNQTAEQLISQYDLAYTVRGKNMTKIIDQTIWNCMKLMDRHPAFPQVWENLDTGRIHIGEKLAQPGLTEIEIAGHFTHNFGMNKITHRMIVDCMGALSKKNARSPFLDWVKKQEWDGEKRLESWIVRLWGAEDTPFYREASLKWLVGACARLAEPGTKIDWMLITIGPQATGKTSMPEILFRGNSVVLYGGRSDKDFQILLHSGLCVVFDELDSFTKHDQNTLKSIISTTNDIFRKPYASGASHNLRRCTLYGCGNSDQFLGHDPTGYRRYAIIEVPRLLSFTELEAEIGQIWAEAWQIYRGGECRYWEVEGASNQAEGYVWTSPMMDRVERALSQPSFPAQFSSLELYERMGLRLDPMPMNVIKEIAQCLQEADYERVNVKVDGKVKKMWRKRKK